MTSSAPHEPRLLAVLRHATALDSAASDKLRPLGPAGPAQARAAATWLADQGFVPDHVLVSDALRTRQSLEAALEVWPDADPLLDINPALYEAGPEAALDLVRTVPLETRALLVVGHNPTVAQVAGMLDDGSGRATSPLDGYPPASVTLFEVTTPWLDLWFCGAGVRGFRVGSTA